jgi:hypothetical protein
MGEKTVQEVQTAEISEVLRQLGAEGIGSFEVFVKLREPGAKLLLHVDVHPVENWRLDGLELRKVDASGGGREQGSEQAQRSRRRSA